MRRVIFILCLACAYSCQDNPKNSKTEGTEDSLLTTTFRDYREIGMLSDYKKISDTFIFTGGFEDDYRLLRLRENNKDLVLFYEVVDRDSIIVNNFSYRVLDTLHITDIKEDEYLSIGNCYHEAFYQGEIISLVKKTDSLQVQSIVKAWRANPESGSLEVLEEFEGIICLNELSKFNGELESLKHLDLRSRVNY